jgi:hypothetical protein
MSIDRRTNGMVEAPTQVRLPRSAITDLGRPGHPCPVAIPAMCIDDLPALVPPTGSIQWPPDKLTM